MNIRLVFSSGIQGWGRHDSASSHKERQGSRADRKGEPFSHPAPTQATVVSPEGTQNSSQVAPTQPLLGPRLLEGRFPPHPTPDRNTRHLPGPPLTIWQRADPPSLRRSPPAFLGRGGRCFPVGSPHHFFNVSPRPEAPATFLASRPVSLQHRHTCGPHLQGHHAGVADPKGWWPGLCLNTST